MNNSEDDEELEIRAGDCQYVVCYPYQYLAELVYALMCCGHGWDIGGHKVEGIQYY